MRHNRLQNKCNCGYAFINFVHPIVILSFFHEYDSRKWRKFNSDKVGARARERAQICKLSYGRIQGKEALQQSFMGTSVMHHHVSERKRYLLCACGRMRLRSRSS